MRAVCRRFLGRFLEDFQRSPDIRVNSRVYLGRAPKGRGSLTSPCLASIISQIQKASEFLSNFVIDAPDNSIEIYDLALATAVVLSDTSSAAVEIGLLVIAVLHPERANNLFLGGESSLGTSYTSDDLSAAISSALERGFHSQDWAKLARLVPTQISQILWLVTVPRLISVRVGRRILTT